MFDLYGFGAQLLQGAAVTLEVAGLSLIFGVVLGILGAAAKLSPLPWLRTGVTLLVNLIRGVPEFLILLIVYFSLPQVVSSLTGTDIAISPLVGRRLRAVDRLRRLCVRDLPRRLRGGAAGPARGGPRLRHAARRASSPASTCPRPGATPCRACRTSGRRCSRTRRWSRCWVSRRSCARPTSPPR